MDVYIKRMSKDHDVTLTLIKAILQRMGKEVVISAGMGEIAFYPPHELAEGTNPMADIKKKFRAFIPVGPPEATDDRALEVQPYSDKIETHE